MQPQITGRQKQLLSIVYKYFENSGYPPTFEEMRKQLNVSSNQSVLDLLVKLEEQGLIKRNESLARSLVILPLGYKTLDKLPLTPFLGTTSAGVPLEAIEISGDWRPLSSDVAKLQDEVFLLKIAGDSMINAGIDDGDMVLVKSEKEFISGDIVLAQIGDKATVKRFVSEDNPPYVYLKPENPKYNIIPFTDEMRLSGKVISIFREGSWRPIN